MHGSNNEIRISHGLASVLASTSTTANRTKQKDIITQGVRSRTSFKSLFHILPGSFQNMQLVVYLANAAFYNSLPFLSSLIRFFEPCLCKKRCPFHYANTTKTAYILERVDDLYTQTGMCEPMRIYASAM